MKEKLCTYASSQLPGGKYWNPEGDIYLVGKNISHKFVLQDTGDEFWYNGFVIDYNHDELHHVIQYEGEEQFQYFDLTVDLIEGDLIVN